MNWGLLVSTFIVVNIVGVSIEGPLWKTLVTIIAFWVVMCVRDYYLLTGGY